ncbi:MAG: 50S ribosome-binding GTPase [Actinomycetaceae bacterium]|nr:50S ribosome-binding GTPase [Actinomycetaceae bacterium]MDY5855091.1 GTPase [Arcanobacterium sp.]
MSVQIQEGAEALEKAVVLSAGYDDSPQRARAREVLAHVEERSHFGFDTTVIAFAGGTGAGKSSLVNAVLGGDYAPVAATRPTTCQVQAVSSASAEQLLSYLDVRTRIVAPELVEIFPALRPRGRHVRARTLVVLDSPDIDSDVMENQQIAHALAQRVDVLIWVLDPQKYADAVIHEKYLHTMSAVANSALVVLNQIDAVPQSQRANVIADVRRLLAADNFQADLEVCSALTGEGIVRLRERINALVKAKSAMAERLAGEIRAAAQNLEDGIRRDGGGEPAPALPKFADVTATLAQGLGADIVARAAGDSYRFRGRQATSWPLVRIVRSSARDPLKRLRLGGAGGHATDGETSGAQTLPSVPSVTGIQVPSAARSATRTAIGSYVRSATQYMPHQWSSQVRTQMDVSTEEFFTQADSLFQRAPIRYDPQPLWWTIANVVQWLVLLIAVVGGVWLAAWSAADVLKLVLPHPPTWGIFPVPTLMLIAGLLGGWLLAGLCTALLSRGALRTQRRVRAALIKAVDTHAKTTIIQPLTSHCERYREFWQALTRAQRTQS